MDAIEIPLTEDGCLPPLPILLTWLRRAARSGTEAVALTRLPYGNSCLPQLLHLAAIPRLICDHPDLPQCWIWEGAAGSRVQVTRGDDAQTGGPIHRGPLPCDPARPRRRSARWDVSVDNGRLADAAATVGYALPTDWDAVVDLVDRPDGERRTRSSDRLRHAHDAALRAFNPLPLERSCIVDLPLEGAPAPWAVTDAHGLNAPVQVIEGPFGPQMLTSLRLAPLECRDLIPLDDPVAGPHWEVDTHCLDNGRVRAEFDDRGLIVRLCIDGRFQPITAPMPAPLLRGVPLAGTASVSVVESGPVRARLGVTWDLDDAVLRLTYTLHAAESCLRIAATWSGEQDAPPLELDHATTWRDGHLRCGGEAGIEILAQNPSVTEPRPQHRHGCRWAWIGDPPGSAGLAVAGMHPLQVSALGGHLRLSVPGTVTYALADARRDHDQLGLAQLATALALPPQPADDVPPRAASVRLSVGQNLVPVWTRQIEDGSAETVFAESEGRQGRALLFPLARASKDASLVDLKGRIIQSLEPTPEEDAWVIDYRPGEICIVRW